MHTHTSAHTQTYSCQHSLLIGLLLGVLTRLLKRGKKMTFLGTKRNKPIVCNERRVNASQGERMFRPWRKVSQSVSQSISCCFEPSQPQSYIRAEHKLHSISKFFFSQVIIPQVMFFEPISIPQAFNTEPASGRVPYCILRACTGTGVSHSQHRKKSRGVFEKCRWMEWTGRNE